jgi:L-serine dehydratase
MRAARRFVDELDHSGALPKLARIRIDLYGSLALTGRGHGTMRGVLLGLCGEQPGTVDPATMADRIAHISANQELPVAAIRSIRFRHDDDFVFHPATVLPAHPNGMRFTAYESNASILDRRVYYSVGGGFVQEDGEDPSAAARLPVPYPFSNGADLLRLGQETGMRIDQIMLANEIAWRSQTEVRNGIHHIWSVMRDCTRRGLETEGELPGGLEVRRRAPSLYRRLSENPANSPLSAMDWLNVFAIAVNEENAAGGRVVTAPTNGAAGIIPAVAHYYMRFLDGTDLGLERYFLAAGAIGVLYKENASISGAEVGCQGEVGVACSMAAGGLVSALGGANEQVEHAAEIGMEHNLGLTCDPIGGLVQIPCIERNAFGAVKAVNAARLAMEDTGGHKVSLDQVIRTMYQTGLDMRSHYKETSLGGLAVTVIEC